MKTKDILLVGAGATIIYLLWRRSKKAKDSKGLVDADIRTSEAPTGGISVGMPLQGTTIVSTKPEKMYPLELPPNMDLPNLTGGTGVPTEVAVQQGGVLTTPTPIISDGYTSCEQKWNKYAQTIKLSSQKAYDDMKANYLMKCDGTFTTPPIVKFPKDLSVSQDVLPASSEEYLNNTIKGTGGKGGFEIATLSANGMNTRGRVINGTLFRGVM